MFTPQLTYNSDTISKRQLFIGGITTYVYNDSVLEEYVKSFNTQHHQEIPINVLYLVHQREGSYLTTQSFAYYILEQFYQKHGGKPKIPLICVTFDNRNHGEKLIDKLKNSDWKRGNSTHAIDMVSCIEGNVADLKLIIDHLQGYLNLEYHLTESFKEKVQPYFTFKNFISGYSLGAHTVIRFANKYPELVEILNPIVGCSDLSSLLINRLKRTPLESEDYDKKYFYFKYGELQLTEEQKRDQYPEYFHNYLSKQDQSIFENFAMHKIKLFASFGAKDTLVPPKLSQVWTELYQNTNDDSEVFIQEDAGHQVTQEMLDRFITWLAKLI
ncbi:Alpha/Beta hydrolase protein [Scheffersomyces amazonensis]|uniref:Alpha/Beta hydrolase protein n=1 Tax=Scheffersomyces amazonensis TaxID=1078765 RepID=UPI00315D50D8